MAIEMHDLAGSDRGCGDHRKGQGASYGAIATCMAAPALWHPSPPVLHVTEGDVGHVNVTR
jgi:hypothetical protein